MYDTIFHLLQFSLLLVSVPPSLALDGRVKIVDQHGQIVSKVKLSQYYNQMFPLTCEGSQRTVWEIPKSANETGLVGLIDDGKILVISVDPDSANIPRHSETASMASRDVLKLLDGQYTCRDIWSGQSATVTLVSPYAVDVSAEAVQYLTKGHPANLSCEATFEDAANDLNSFAFKKGSPVSPPISEQLNKYEVYRPSSGTWNGKWSLGLMDVGQSDQGSYYCVAKYGNFESTSNVKFEVIVDEKPRFETSLPRSVEVLRGGNAIVHCTASGSPKPLISWKKTQNYEKIQNSDRVKVLENGSLSLSDIRVTDGSQYECHADNRAGRVVQTTSLIVNYKPTIRPIPDFTLSETEQVSVQCMVLEAHPPINKFQWYLNGVQIFTGQELLNASVPGSSLLKSHLGSVYELQISMGINNIYSSTLWLKSLDRKSSSGIYACEAINDIGPTTENFSVDVHYRPYPFNGKVEESVKVFQGGDAELTCTLEAKPALQANNFEWKYGSDTLNNVTNRTTFEGQTSTYSIRIKSVSNEMLSSQKTFLCVGSNSIGQFTKIFKLVKLNRPGEVFFRGNFFNITPTSARIRVQLPVVEDQKEEMTGYLFRIEQAEFATNPAARPEIRSLDPLKYNQLTRIAEFLISDLRFSTEYVVSVAAVNRGGEGPFVEATGPLMTADDRVPYQPIIEQVSTGSHNHTFSYRVSNNGGHDVISYQLVYTCGVYKIGPFQSSSRGSRNFIQNSVPISTKNHPEGSRGHFTIDNLLPNSTCQFRLAASNVKGYGPEIIWVTHTMPSSEKQEKLDVMPSNKLLVVAFCVTLALLIAMGLLLDFCMYFSTPSRSSGCVAPLLCNKLCLGTKQQPHVKPSILREQQMPIGSSDKEINL